MNCLVRNENSEKDFDSSMTLYQEEAKPKGYIKHYNRIW